MSDFLHYIFPFAPETKERKLAREILTQLKGGEGSGNFGHAGRPGEVGGSASSDESTAPMFEDYDDAQAWIEQRSRDYGGKNKFTSSPEYASAYPIIKNLYDSERKGFIEQAKKAMDEVGVKVGDKVTYTYVNPFMGAETYTGKLFLRNGVPFVKLDTGQTTMNNKTTTRWHKGWTAQI